MRLVLIRHAATAGNEAHRYVGKRTDEPLSAEGRRQCERAGAYPSVDRVYVSPQLRARQTAELCFPHARQVVVPGIEEFDFGVFERRTADEMADDVRYRRWVESGCVAPCPGGETRDEFARRTQDALCQLLKDAARRKEGLVVVVAHGGTIMAALDGFYDKHVRNCEGYEARVLIEGTRVRLVEDRPILLAECFGS
jgi:alpha-ribazole phosphatase